ncbi:MAG: efflux RND transporter periplasmic adaptor subunit [Dysgonamonadaceae bacterium]|nr:efflux RND transporter periplasmic adaptor subunit [Dysgonamonadaceae bacterium]
MNYSSTDIKRCERRHFSRIFFRISLCFSAFLGLGLLVACGEKQEKQTVEKIKVKTTQVQVKPVSQLFTYTASVQADVINQITPAIPARIEQIYVEVGSPVSKGQLLVQMESSTYKQQHVQLENLKKDYERYEELYKVGGISQQQMDQLKTQIDVLSTAVKNVEDNTRLTSPINGIVTARNYDNGDVYGGSPILTVQQLNPLKAIIQVSESNFPQIKVGMTVDILLDVYGDEVFTGKITLIHPTIDPNMHTFGVEVTIHNRNMRVRPGMVAHVTLNLGTTDHILVPDVAVLKQVGANDKYVFVLEKDSVAVYHKVELGRRLGDYYEIISGLEDGSKVITAGQNRLTDKTIVEIVKE